MSYNRAVLVGRLTKDPELRYMSTGKPLATFTLAVDRPKSTDGESKADFINIVAWEKKAELATQYLSKGSLILIEGHIQVRSYTAQDGSKRQTTEVVADGIRFLESKKRQQELPQDDPKVDPTANVPF